MKITESKGKYMQGNEHPTRENIKGDKIFEIERDLDNACVSATYCKYEGKQLVKCRGN